MLVGFELAHGRPVQCQLIGVVYDAIEDTLRSGQPTGWPERPDSDSRAGIVAGGRPKLALDPAASKRIQIALRDQGSDPGDIDGMLGPQSRNAIIAWQKSRNEPPTGYLSAAQYKSLLEASRAAITKFELNTQQ